MKEKPPGACGGFIVLGLLLCAALAPWIATHPYDQTNVRQRLKPPGLQFDLDTDNLGRDICSRIIYGARVSVTVGFGAVTLSIVLVTTLSVVSGYFGGTLLEAARGRGEPPAHYPALYPPQCVGANHHHRHHWSSRPCGSCP